MAIYDRKFCNKIFAFIFIQDHVLFSGGTYEQVSLSLLIILISDNNLVIVGNAGISLCLLMLIALFVVVILIVDRVI